LTKFASAIVAEFLALTTRVPRVSYSCRRPAAVMPCRPSNSKAKLQRQGRTASLVLGGGDGAEVGVGLCTRREVVDRGRVGVAWIEMVECVEGFNPQLQYSGFFAQPKFFVEA